MEYLLENILNMVGFLVGLCIGLASYLGYKNTGSPVLFRMSVAFLSIAIGIEQILSMADHRKVLKKQEKIFVGVLNAEGEIPDFADKDNRNPDA